MRPGREHELDFGGYIIRVACRAKSARIKGSLSPSTVKSARLNMAQGIINAVLCKYVYNLVINQGRGCSL